MKKSFHILMIGFALLFSLGLNAQSRAFNSFDHHGDYQCQRPIRVCEIKMASGYGTCKNSCLLFDPL